MYDTTQNKVLHTLPVHIVYIGMWLFIPFPFLLLETMHSCWDDFQVRHDSISFQKGHSYRQAAENWDKPGDNKLEAILMPAWVNVAVANWILNWMWVRYLFSWDDNL